MEQPNEPTTPFVRSLLATDLFAEHLALTPPLLTRTAPQGLPESRSAPAYVQPRSDLWVAVQGGLYDETRTWHGHDDQLVNSLNATETHHQPWGTGVLIGREYRSGWGVSIGAEYVSAHYDFEHEDHIITRTTMITPILVTLNAMVVGQFVDTTVTVDDQRHTVEAINRYSVIRLPVEGSYHHDWRRWTYGVRGWVAGEYLTMHSGYTLTDPVGDGNAQAVEVDGEGRTRSAIFLSAGAGLDLGYSLAERWGLWMTPGYSIGLMPLGDNDLYALPQQLGLRLRLSYTFPHHP